MKSSIPVNYNTTSRLRKDLCRRLVLLTASMFLFGYIRDDIVMSVDTEQHMNGRVQFGFGAIRAQHATLMFGQFIACQVYIQQFAGRYIQGAAKSGQNIRVGTVEPLLPIGDAGVADAELLGELFLGQFACFAIVSYALANLVFHSRSPLILLYRDWTKMQSENQEKLELYLDFPE